MPITTHFTKRQALLRMPRTTPGAPDANGFVFHGPVGTGQIDVATASLLDSKRACAATHNPAAGGPLANDPVLAPLANRVPAAPPPSQVVPALDAHTPPHPARLLATGPAAGPVLRLSGPPATAETDRVLASLRGEHRSLPRSSRKESAARFRSPL